MKKVMKALLAVPLVGLSLGPVQAQEVVYFSIVMVREPTHHANEFIFGVTHPQTIATLRREIANSAGPHPMIVTGKIEKGRKNYNEAWPFHYIPSTVQVISQATEICSATPEEIEDHLDKVGTDFLPDNEWCPWSARFVREVNVSNAGESSETKAAKPPARAKPAR